MTRIFAITLLMFLPAAAAAEVYECNGKWTNRPCDGEVTRSIQEVGAGEPSDPNIKLIRQKTSLLHDLRMRTIQAKSNYGVSYDITTVEERCLKKPTTTEECGELIEKAQVQLDQRIAAASAVIAQQRALELQQEENRLREERNRIEENKPNITVIEENPIVVVPGRRGYGPGYSTGSGPGYTSGSGISISGSSASGSVSVNAGTTTTTYSSSGYPVIINPQPRPQYPPRTNSGVTVHDNFGNPKRIEGVKPGPFAPKKNNSSLER